MTDIKRQVLTRLYALRGSISYLSQEVKGFTQKEELATKALEEIEDKYCEEKYGYKKLYVAHRMLDVCNTIQREREIKGLPPLSDSDLVDEGMARYEREHGIYDVEAQERNIKYYEDKVAEEQRKHKKSKKVAWACVGVILAGIFIMVLFAAILDDMAGFAAIGGVLFWAGVMGLIFLPGKFSRSREISRAQGEVEKAKKTKEIYIEKNRKIQALKTQVDAAKQAIENIKNDKDERIGELYPVYKATVAAYSDMIDESDWKYSDLLIYYFETKRADDMKEALQLLDRLADKKVKTENTKQVREQMKKYIAESSEEMAEDICAVYENICADTAADADDLENALYDSANTSSISLMENIECIVKYKPRKSGLSKS